MRQFWDAKLFSEGLPQFSAAICCGHCADGELCSFFADTNEHTSIPIGTLFVPMTEKAKQLLAFQTHISRLISVCKNASCFAFWGDEMPRFVFFVVGG